MERSLVIICFCALSVFAFFSLKKMVTYNNNTVLCGSAVLFSILLYYCVVPIIVLCCESVNNDSGFVFIIQNSRIGSFFYSIFLIVLLILSYLFFYYNKKIRFKSKWIDYKTFRSFYKIDKRFFLFTFLIGGLSLIIYIYSFGSIAQLLFYAEYLRSFATSATDIVSYEASILVVPARLITVTPLLILPLYYRYKKKSYFIYFLVSLFLACIFLLANAGRTYIISFLLMFAVPILMKKFKHPWFIVILAGLFGMQLLDVLDTLFIYLKTDVWNQEETNIIHYLGQFSYPISNVLNVSGIVDSNNGFRYGQDFITGLLNIIPGVNFPTSIEPTSFFYGGSDWHTAGGVPNDIITFGYLEFGIFGPIIMGALLGIITRKADCVLIKFNRDYGLNVFKCAIVVCSFLYIVNADIISLVRNQMQTTCLFFCILYAYYKIGNRQPHNILPIQKN